MSTNFHIEFKKRNDNLHVRAEGDFDGTSAWELLNVLHDHYNGRGSVFIDISRLRQVHPFGCCTFKCRLNRKRLPAERLFFKGEKGLELAPEGSKVITTPEAHRCRCNGNCRQCKCTGQDKHNLLTTSWSRS